MRAPTQQRGFSGAKRALLLTCLAAGSSAMLPPLASAASVRADFNGDGRSDLAVGASHEDAGPSGDSIPDAGVVNILYGTDKGLAPTGAQQFTQADAGGSVEASDFFGSALAAGDFNGDKKADLAIGVGGENANSTTEAGVVNILYGSEDGLTKSGAQQLTQQEAKGTVEADDSFGGAIAAGDFSGDGRADLAVGATGEDVGSAPVVNAGVVNILLGSKDGITSKRARELTQQDAGSVDVEQGDRFGSALTTGDFDGNGTADLAVGTPFEGFGGPTETGQVNILYGSGGGLTSSFPQQFTEQGAQPANRFGSALAAGDFNGDKKADLAVGAPSASAEDVEPPVAGAGMVSILLGSGSGLTVKGSQRFSQQYAAGTAEGGDVFGAALAAGDFNGNGKVDLAVGAPLEALGSPPVAQAGVVNVLYGSDFGVRGNGSREIDQQDAGGAVEEFDSFGYTLTAGNFHGGKRSDLAIGAVFEDVGADEDAGAVDVLLGSKNGLGVGTAYRREFTQDDADGAIEEQDFWGAGLG